MAKKPAQQKEVPLEDEYETLDGELCPFCHNKSLVLLDIKKEIPFFGTCYIFSMDCKSCNYHKSDIEREWEHDPLKSTLEITKEDDMKIRVVKSSTATIKISHIGSIEAGPASNGYVTNVEGILNRMKVQIEQVRDNEEEDEEVRKKAKNLVKKLTRIMWGQDTCRLTLEDPSGNSAIISEKAVVEKLSAASSQKRA
jgi:zinc finger protein